MKPTHEQVQRYLLAAERTTVDLAVATWARSVLEREVLRSERDQLSPPPKPERLVYHTR